MEASRRQGSLFPNHSLAGKNRPLKRLNLNADLLRSWQDRLHKHQEALFLGQTNHPIQTSFLESENVEKINELNPLKLTPLPIIFWRWPTSPHKGPAIYLVMDRPTGLKTPLLLYVGETIAANRRWKSTHDCKEYLAAYTEALTGAGLTSQLSIRFWTDVPKQTKARRQIEQKLIQRWLPPFNKETRARWTTPFTSNIN